MRHEKFDPCLRKGKLGICKREARGGEQLDGNHNEGTESRKKFEPWWQQRKRIDPAEHTGVTTKAYAKKNRTCVFIEKNKIMYCCGRDYNKIARECEPRARREIGRVATPKWNKIKG
jgi:hypothetical protein